MKVWEFCPAISAFSFKTLSIKVLYKSAKDITLLISNLIFRPRSFVCFSLVFSFSHVNWYSIFIFAFGSTFSTFSFSFSLNQDAVFFTYYSLQLSILLQFFIIFANNYNFSFKSSHSLIVFFLQTYLLRILDGRHFLSFL